MDDEMFRGNFIRFILVTISRKDLVISGQTKIGRAMETQTAGQPAPQFTENVN